MNVKMSDEKVLEKEKKMEVPEHRKWMDERTGPDKKKVTNEFMAGVVEFIDFACAKENYKQSPNSR